MRRGTHANPGHACEILANSATTAGGADRGHAHPKGADSRSDRAGEQRTNTHTRVGEASWAALATGWGLMFQRAGRNRADRRAVEVWRARGNSRARSTLWRGHSRRGHISAIKLSHVSAMPVVAPFSFSVGSGIKLSCQRSLPLLYSKVMEGYIVKGKSAGQRIFSGRDCAGNARHATELLADRENEMESRGHRELGGKADGDHSTGNTQPKFLCRSLFQTALLYGRCATLGRHKRKRVQQC